ncbi:hypothetical protein C789_3567 [Microcystis aeruginosa FACHB-905 = DIANCHI905]|uniref:Uncharacterized protein n=1 Tax=Microcystis aeruginosa PCC 7806SL TaxID=1903187 RepID=A0AB33BRM3_MICA7|nr:hypothetical protein BH695_3323 [Microcystis aeruginosa PCC 7806SL]ELS46618.1 hypothetical protein C789_3567 [Microcystis aeruginosa FACHB-905 = DIANCHI905]
MNNFWGPIGEENIKNGIIENIGVSNPRIDSNLGVADLGYD